MPMLGYKSGPNVMQEYDTIPRMNRRKQGRSWNKLIKKDIHEFFNVSSLEDFTFKFFM
jgi:hypothetical protein